jgi:glycine/D-amino acid oxidase-like deaminating enzyme
VGAFPTAGDLYNSYYDATDIIEKLVAEEGIDCGFARNGKLSLAAKPAHYEGMKRTYEVLTERMGVDTTLVPPARSARRSARLATTAASWTPSGPGCMRASSSRDSARARSGRVPRSTRRPASSPSTAWEARVTSSSRRGAGSAPTGSWSPPVATPRGPSVGSRSGIAPVGSFIIVTEPLGKEVCDQLLPNRRMCSDSKNLLYYFRITPDHRLLFGGRARFAMAGPRSDQKCGRILRGAMVSVFPQLGRAKVDYCWGGLVDMSMDRLVHAGEQDGLFHSVGYSGHGVQMATYMGKQMADYMDGVLEANPWRDIPFRRIPGYFGSPWFLPFAGAYYKFQDVIR